MKTLHVGDTLHGFTLIGVDDQSEYRGTGYRFCHDATGLDLYHLNCDDSENLFSFAFKTPPFDDTGVPHIIEHSVLSGSARYPVKDPFLALMRGSMNTFLNAMTYPDKTVYPAASPVAKDYFNLMAVYGDAVFFPTLSEDVFRQEGHRLEADEEGRYGVTGIVFNEMKGAYSNHDSIVGEWSYRSLFPDTPYHYDSGGDPLSIPKLSYEAFRDFHRRAYHPSNCRIFLYGDIDTEQQLEFLQDHFLSRFTMGKKASDIPMQPRWNGPRRFSFTSPADGDENTNRSSVVLSWIVGEISKPDEVLALEVLSEILIGHVGSPLYKAMVDSRLGEDISPVSGLETDLKELIFAVGLRGIDPRQTGALEDLVTKCFQNFVDQGLSREAVEGAMTRVEFRQREIKGGYPFGLRLMGKLFRGWLHGEDPGTSLAFAAPMKRLKERVAADPHFFEDLLRDRFLSNNHRATVIVTPDAEHETKIEQELDELAHTLVEGKNQDGLAAIEEKNRRLRAFQDKPDSSEALATIPTLSMQDVPAEVDRIETTDGLFEGVRCFSHNFFTNGILYADFVFDLAGLSREELLYLPLLTRLLLHTALPDMSYDQVAHRLFKDTGGFYSFLESSPVIGEAGVYRNYLVFRLKALEENGRLALNLAVSILLQGVLTDTQRLKDVLLEMRNDVVSDIVPSGNSVATMRAAAGFSPSLATNELWRGVEQLLFLDGLVKKGEAGFPGALSFMERLRSSLLVKNRLLCNITADGAFLPEAEALMRESLGSFPQGDVTAFTSPHLSLASLMGEASSCREEALIVPASVNFVALVFPAATIDSAAHSHQLILAQLLKTTFLWERIRMRGGAYGAGAFANGIEGIFGLSSYRDPHILSTVDAFREGLRIVAEEGVDQAELEKAIITLVGKETRPQSPGEKSMIGFRRILYGLTDRLRQSKRDTMRASTVEAVSLAAASLLSALDSSHLVVLGGDAAVSKAEDRFTGLGTRRTRLPG